LTRNAAARVQTRIGAAFSPPPPDKMRVHEALISSKVFIRGAGAPPKLKRFGLEEKRKHSLRSFRGAEATPGLAMALK